MPDPIIEDERYVTSEEDSVALVLVDRDNFVFVDAEAEYVVVAELDAAFVSDSDVDLVQIDEVDTIIIASGEQGPRGIPGPIPPNSTISFPFRWGDATPADLGAFLGVLVTVSIIVLTPFDGVNTQLSVYGSGHPDLLPAADVIPSELGRYESNPGVHFGTSTQIYLNITPGAGASQGEGIVYLEITQ